MDRISQIEAELRQMEAVYAQKRSALAKLEDACRRKYAELIEAKAARDAKIATDDTDCLPGMIDASTTRHLRSCSPRGVPDIGIPGESN